MRVTINKRPLRPDYLYIESSNNITLKVQAITTTQFSSLFTRVQNSFNVGITVFFMSNNSTQTLNFKYFHF